MPCHCHCGLEGLKACIPILFYEQHFIVKEICKILGIKKSLAYSSLEYFRTYGITHNPHIHCKTGWQHLLDSIDIKFVSSLIGQKHTIYLDEIQDELYQHQKIQISVLTLCRTLCWLAFTHKVVLAHALKQDNLAYLAFMNFIANEVSDSWMMMFIDEAARNWRTS